MEEANILKNSLMDLKDVPIVEIDISSSIEQRYHKIFGQINIKNCKHIIEEIYNEYFSFSSLLTYYLNYNQYWDEVVHLSKLLEINPFKLYTFGIILDNINNTSSISSNFNDKKYLIKTFEINSRIDIKPLLYKVVYTKNGIKQYETINILGSVGFYNVKNFQYNYSISLSSRKVEKNIKFLGLTSSYLLRNITESNCSFDNSLEKLCKTPILQPVFFLTFKYNQKYSYVIQRDTNSHQIIKKDTVIVTDVDEQTLTPNINFSVSRYLDIEKMKHLSIEKFLKKFLSFPIIRESTQFILLQNEDDDILKYI